MSQQICPNCQTANPGDNRYCGRCGAALPRYAIVPSASRLPIPAQERWLRLARDPAVQTAAVSLGAVLLRSGLAWIRRRAVRRLLPGRRDAFPEISSRGMIRSGPGFLPRRDQPAVRITMAWWEILVESRGPSSGDELDPPDW